MCAAKLEQLGMMQVEDYDLDESPAEGRSACDE